MTHPRSNQSCQSLFVCKALPCFITIKSKLAHIENFLLELWESFKSMTFAADCKRQRLPPILESFLVILKSHKNRMKNVFSCSPKIQIFSFYSTAEDDNKSFIFQFHAWRNAMLNLYILQALSRSNAQQNISTCVIIFAHREYLFNWVRFWLKLWQSKENHFKVYAWLQSTHCEVV